METCVHGDLSHEQRKGPRISMIVDPVAVGRKEMNRCEEETKDSDGENDPQETANQQNNKEDKRATKLHDNEVGKNKYCTNIPGLGAKPLNNSGTVQTTRRLMLQLFRQHKAREFFSDLREKATTQAARRRVVSSWGRKARGSRLGSRADASAELTA